MNVQVAPTIKAASTKAALDLRLMHCICLGFLLLSVPMSLNAQLKNMDKRIERKVKSRIDQKADRMVDKTLQTGEKKMDEAVKTKPKEKSASGPAAQKEQAKDTRKSDFSPGEKIIFFDDFEGEPEGDFPARWNTSGSGEIVQFKNLPGKWLRVPDNTTSFPELSRPLPENFTIDFDLYYPSGTTRPPVTFGFTEVKNPAKEALTHKKIFYFRIPPSVDNNVGYSTTLYSGKETTTEWPANKMAGKMMHVSIAVNKQRVRLYIDQNKLFDLPKGFDPAVLRNNFHFRAAQLMPKPKDGFYVSNIRIAEATPDARAQLINNGKYTTTSILFNTGSAVIKPESFTVIKEIAQILESVPDMRLQIIGHTDNTGSESANKTLSEKRAASVKEYLVKSENIDAGRLTTDGKGASEPMATNTTAEGKAQNRRVEFIKLR